MHTLSVYNAQFFGSTLKVCFNYLRKKYFCLKFFGFIPQLFQVTKHPARPVAYPTEKKICRKFSLISNSPQSHKSSKFLSLFIFANNIEYSVQFWCKYGPVSNVTKPMVILYNPAGPCDTYSHNFSVASYKKTIFKAKIKTSIERSFFHLDKWIFTN